ncbi:phage tail protein [uncultured Pseudomonas sp.]|uniref:phage tail protein n=1 Tax=uncultured Pseudomonas sp. TaxID=114707 RepID=UPI0025929612|nr:phage tail protein [uncultured Pseudomonas sp.]
MIDQNSQFQAILTAIGEAKQANADALGIPWTFAQMGVGDANGTDPFPNRLQTKLINERRRAPLNQLKPDPKNPGIIIAEQVIPENVGGFWIREIGLYDTDGDLVAIANCAPTFKPLLAQGSGRTQIIRMNLIVSSLANIVLKIDPAVVLATREYVDSSIDAVLPGNKTPGTYRQVTINKYGIVVSGSNPTTLAGYGITNGLTSTPQSGVVGAIADIPVTTLGTYIPATTDKPSVSSNGLFLRMKWPGGNIAFDIFGHIGGGADVLAFRRVLGDGSYTMRYVYHDGNFNPALKANLDSPALTGVPTAPTAPPGSNYGELANCAFVWAAVNTYATTVTASLATKANLNSPALTGIPTVPTAAPGTNSLQAANTAFVAAALAALVDSSPGALDTLNELAKALGNDPNFATTMTNALAAKAAKATTLAGYGILDAYTKTALDALLNGKAGKANTLGGYGINDAIRNSNPLPGGSIDIHGETYAFLTSPLESCLAQNCYWNGTNWVRHNTAAPAVCIAAVGGAVVLRTAPAGTGSIVWTNSDPLWTSANATLTTSAGNATLRLPNGWIEQVFEVTESTGATDHRYFPVSFPNECFGVFPSLLSTTAGGYANNSGLVVGDVTKDRFVISAGGNFSPEGRFRIRAIGR